MTARRVALIVLATLAVLGLLAAVPVGYTADQVGQALEVDPTSTANRDLVRTRVAGVLGVPGGQPQLSEYGELKTAYTSDLQAGGILALEEIAGLEWKPHSAGNLYEFGFDPQTAFPHLNLPDLALADAVSGHWADRTVIRVFRLPDGRGLMTYVSY